MHVGKTGQYDQQNVRQVCVRVREREKESERERGQEEEMWSKTVSCSTCVIGLMPK